MHYACACVCFRHEQIQVMPAGAETSLFKGFFLNWLDKDETTDPGQTYTIGSIACVQQIPFDAATLHDNQAMAAQHGMVDDGSGKVQVCPATLMPYYLVFKSQHVDVTVVFVCRFGAWKVVKKLPSTRPPMDSSMEVTVTWCCTPTMQEAERSISSTPGECSLINMAIITC